MMSDKPTNWMPFWLATYIFMIGLLVMEIAVDMFIMTAEEVGLEYFWYHGVLMCAAVGLPWVWYFTYLAHRYLDTIPRLCYLWIFTPFIFYTYQVFGRETLYSDIFISNGIIYFINIGWDVIIPPAIVIIVWHELRNHRGKYIDFLHRAKEAINV